MNTDPDHTQHPDNLSDEDKAGIAKIIGGEEAKPESDVVADKVVEKKDDEKEVLPAAAVADEKPDPAAEKQTIMVPKARLDEETAKRRTLESEAELLRSQLSALSQSTNTDFDARYKAVREKYNDGDLSLDEREEEIRKIANEETAYIAKKTTLEAQQEVVATRETNDWNQVALAWETENADFLADAERAKVMENAIRATQLLYENKIGHAELLKEAEELAFKRTGWKVEPATTENGKTNAGDLVRGQRRQEQARATASASTMPDALTSGHGARSGADKVDINNMTREQWDKLPQAERDRHLGITT